MSKITQDELRSNLNLSIELNGTIEVHETQVEEASIIIIDNTIHLTS